MSSGNSDVEALTEPEPVLAEASARDSDVEAPTEPAPSQVGWLETAFIEVATWVFWWRTEGPNWVFRKVFSLDVGAPDSKGYDADRWKVGFNLGYAFNLFTAALFVYSVVSQSLQAQSLFSTSHRVLGGLTVTFLVLPTLLFGSALLLIVVGTPKKFLFEIFSMAFNRVKADYQRTMDIFFRRKPGEELRGCIVVCLVVPLFLFSTAFTLVLYISSIAFLLLTLCPVGVLLLVVLCFTSVYFDIALVLAGIFAHLKSPLFTSAAGRYRNLRGLFNAIFHSLPQSIVQVVMFSVGTGVPRWTLVSSFVSLVASGCFSTLALYVQARDFCHQKGLNGTSITYFFDKGILDPLFRDVEEQVQVQSVDSPLASCSISAGHSLRGLEMKGMGSGGMSRICNVCEGD